MSATNPLFDKKMIEAGGAYLKVVPLEDRDAFMVEIHFPLEGFRVYCSKWANPLRCALEAAEEALNQLKCAIFNEELNEGKPYEKPKSPEEPIEEKADG